MPKEAHMSRSSKTSGPPPASTRCVIHNLKIRATGGSMDVAGSGARRRRSREGNCDVVAIGQVMENTSPKTQVLM